MRRSLFTSFFVILTLLSYGKDNATKTDYTNALRAPSVPLLTVDPFFSLWSSSDELTSSVTTHWTGIEHPLVGALKVDGVSYRIIGKEDECLEAVLPGAIHNKWVCMYTNAKPASDWAMQSFDDSAWKRGYGAFGSQDRSPATVWNTKDIWVRRTFNLKDDISKSDLVLEYSHDDVFELYVNGIQVANTGNRWRDGVRVVLDHKVKQTLKGGKVTIAAHCHNTTGGSYVDFGLYKKIDNGAEFKNVARQKSVNVLPTRTIYTLACGAVELDLVFTAPLLMNDLDLLSVPVNYLTYKVRSTDGKQHAVELYIESSPLMAVNSADQPVVCSVGSADGVDYLKAGTVSQKILERQGDRVCIDWGYFYMAKIGTEGTMTIADYYQSKIDFIKGEKITSSGSKVNCTMGKEKLGLVYYRDLGNVGKDAISDFIMLAYDDIWSIQYFGQNLRPYWNRKSDKTFTVMLENSGANYKNIIDRCVSFDNSLMSKALADGGKKYAELCAMIYRQAISAHKLVEDQNGNILFLSKENASNGSIGTVDVTYPSTPMFLLYNPELVKGMLNHIFYYTESGRWTKPFAAHDVGTYPRANGQTYGGDMPVEETGNMLIITAAVAHLEGNANYAAKHWATLTTWTDYLVKEGLDPANQLCTDDFAGHFAHNTNLSIKAIMGIACYADMARILGKTQIAEKYMATAKQMADQWKQMASDGDHYRLTFDKSGTWSQKYNLVWDKLLGLNIFDPSIANTEMAYYLNKQNKFGLPLDNRKDYTKSDWIIWTACLTDNVNDFNALIAPIYDYVNMTTSRVPVGDWHDTKSGEFMGFRARSVVAGYYMKMLKEKFKEGAKESVN